MASTRYGKHVIREGHVVDTDITREKFDWVLRRTEAKSVFEICLLYTSPSPRDVEESRMPSSA